MKKKIIAGFLLAIAVAAALWFGYFGRRSADIVIVSTNDIHGAIERMPALATLVDRVRNDNAHVLLVDAGDKWTGNPFVDLWPEKGKPVIDLMNELGYDVTTIGNHGFDWGGSVLDKRIGESRFATVLTNVRSDSAYLSRLSPYVLVTAGGVRLGFLGLLGNSRNGYPDGNPENYTGLHFSDPIRCAIRHKGLKDSCDILIGLTHIGDGKDSLLAASMPELDLIIGGHSHTETPQGRRVNGVLITQAGNSLRYAGITRLRFIRGRLREKTYRLVALDTVPPDLRVASQVEAYRHTPVLQSAIGRTTTKMDRTALANFISDAMLEESGADFALVNWNGIRTDSLPAGEITGAAIYAMEPFSDEVVVHAMRLADLRELILNKFNEESNEGHTVDLCPAGGRYVIRIDDQGNGTGIVFYDRRGERLPEDERIYRVALSSYVSRTYDFSQKGKGQPQGAQLTAILQEYLRGHSPITVSDHSRVSIEPER